MALRFGDDLKRHIVRNLDRFDVETVDDPALRRAAVVIVVAPLGDGSEAGVLLTLRPRTIKRHAGQYALPGGRLDPGETPTEAALRELQEELGLSVGASAVLGFLDDYPTRSGFRITPVIAWGRPGMEIDPDPTEVDTVFHVPLDQLDSPDIPILSDPVEGDRPVLSMYLPVLGNRMFAPTAAILYQFREVALRGETTRVSAYDQPGFAWR